MWVKQGATDLKINLWGNVSYVELVEGKSYLLEQIEISSHFLNFRQI